MIVNGNNIWRYVLLLVLMASALFAAARVAAAVCPAADAEALALLEKMARSLQQVSYHGVVTFQRGDDMQVMEVSNSVVDGLSTERLAELTGQGAEVVRIKHPLTCIHPGHKLLTVGAGLQGDGCGMAAYYRFSVAPGGLVAGRQSVQVQIEPRDMYRYGYVMELDRETGLLLKSVTVGRGNKILEKLQFASLSFTQDMSATAMAHVVHKARHTEPGTAQLSTGSAGPAWTVNWLPQGFTATDQPAEGSGRRTYTDGLTVFSVFLELLSEAIRPGEGVFRTGGTISYTRGMQLAGQSVLVTVIGEVPINTARMVADSIAGEY